MDQKNAYKPDADVSILGYVNYTIAHLHLAVD